MWDHLHENHFQNLLPLINIWRPPNAFLMSPPVLVKKKMEINVKLAPPPPKKEGRQEGKKAGREAKRKKKERWIGGSWDEVLV